MNYESNEVKLLDGNFYDFYDYDGQLDCPFMKILSWRRYASFSCYDVMSWTIVAGLRFSRRYDQGTTGSCFLCRSPGDSGFQATLSLAGSADVQYKDS